MDILCCFFYIKPYVQYSPFVHLWSGLVWLFGNMTAFHSAEAVYVQCCFVVWQLFNASHHDHDRHCAASQCTVVNNRTFVNRNTYSGNCNNK